MDKSLSNTARLHLIIAKCLWNNFKEGVEFSAEDSRITAALADFGNLRTWAFEVTGKNNEARYIGQTPWVIGCLRYSEHLATPARGVYKFTAQGTLAFKTMNDRQLLHTWSNGWDRHQIESGKIKPEKNKVNLPDLTIASETIALPPVIHQKLKTLADKSYRTLAKQIEYLVDKESSQ